MPTDELVEWLARFMELTEGRDKLGRLLQYVSLFLKWSYSAGDKDLSERFNLMSKALRRGRKLIRLGEFLLEIPRITELLHSKRIQNIEAKTSLLVSRGSYIVYWLIDHYVTLIRIGLFKGETRLLNRIQYGTWFVGLLSSFLFNCVSLRLTYKREAEMKTTAIGNMTPKQLLGVLDGLSRERVKILLNLFRNGCDSMIASQHVGLNSFLLKTEFNDGLMGVLGLVSSLVAIYQVHVKESRKVTAVDTHDPTLAVQQY
eukprot:TRINITY_DN5558_c0_g1_i1.p1 TRINITY_DN5558_c0_g1~~TRINITY_DN5558_c0_g1_i1.p1  ORF type:complete len:258 (+),score=6.10 TRINITY_DN5558_c0_g1_i1:162-935(+)